jgi:hypothetical protein
MGNLMARQEADREDLIREAVALPERVELRVPGFDDLITIGFRANSAMSVFIGQDPVYQFDPGGRLRRAFVAGFLFRSQHETLARLQRQRTATETHLLRDDLNAEELSAFRECMLSTLRRVFDEVNEDNAQVMRCVPQELDLLPKIKISLQAVFETSEWLSTNIRPRR